MRYKKGYVNQAAIIIIFIIIIYLIGKSKGWW